MNKNIGSILAFLTTLFPSPSCELEFHEDYQLVIAVMLSAQSTDSSVNRVTRQLFAKYPSLEALSKSEVGDLENEIRSLGLYHHKARNIKKATQKILLDYKGIVPSNKEELLSLPGIGVKSANVIRAVYFNIPEMPVDTHVTRIAKRLGLVAEGSTVKIIEEKLRNLIPKNKLILAHHQLIHFGRYFCTARSPKCEHCALKNFCLYYQKQILPR